jgi:MFS family permease
MLLPFVFIQYPLGILADKYFGEKEMLVFSLLIMGITTAYLPFIESKTIAVWALALFATRFGSASADILRDSYFYKRVGKNDIDIIAFFRTARPLANIAAAAFTGILLVFFPLNIVFFLIVAILFVSLLSAVTLVDNASERSLAEERVTL